MYCYCCALYYNAYISSILLMFYYRARILLPSVYPTLHAMFLTLKFDLVLMTISGT